MDFFGLTFVNTHSFSDISSNLTKLHKWFVTTEWYIIYDFIEAYLNFLPSVTSKDTKKHINNILAWENSGYRIAGTTVVPITNDIELKNIENCANYKIFKCKPHIEKAAALFSRRTTPDYENSIKESISAVEAICCTITGNKGATLSDALKKLESKGVKLHKAFQNAMSSLYGYASDESGIRHGNIDFTGASREDAKYMLVSCSAFVNYLIEKWEKVSEQRSNKKGEKCNGV
jgi:hypothetical protein